MSFRVGEKVVCVTKANSPKLAIDEIYTVCGHPCGWSGCAVYLKEVKGSAWERIGVDNGYWNWHFRLLDEAFAEEVLENIKEQIKEEELILN